MPNKKSKTISDTLRHAIHESGHTHYRIAKDAKISPYILDCFMDGSRSLRLNTVDKICEVLGLELVPIRLREAA